MSDPRGVLLDRIISEINDLRRRVEAQEAQEQTPRAQKARALDTQFPDALLHLPFDGGVPYETDYSVNLAGHKLQFPTVASGGIIGRPGKFGKAVQLAEATTNLCVNPSFETDVTTGWTFADFGTGGGRVKSTSDGSKFGLSVLRMWTGTGSVQVRTNNIALAAGDSVTIQAWVRNLSSGTASISIYDSTNAMTRASTNTASTSWTWLTCTWTNDTGASANVYMTMGKQGASSTGLYDGAQMEKKAYPTPYCDGSLGPGHAWTGTAHASTSTRAEASLQYPTAGSLPNGAQQGTVSLWAMVTGDTGVNQYAFAHWRGSGNERIYIYKTAAGGWQMGLGDGVGLVASGIHPVPGEWQHLVATWDNGTAALYIDGALIGSGSYTPFTAMDPVLHLGESTTGTLPLNGYLDDLLILDRALTATEVKRLYEAGQAGLGVLCPPQWKVDDSGAADAHVVATRDDGAVPFGPQSYIGHYGVRAQSGVTEVLQIRPGLEGSNIVQVSVGAFVSNGTRYYYMGVGYGRARAGSAGFVNVATLHSTMPGNPNVTLAWNQEVLEVSLTGISGYTTDFAVNYIVTYRG